MLFAAIVVIYNKSCADSLTCRALKEIGNSHTTTLIFDNSTQDFDNRTYCKDQGWHYLGGSGNLGLSKAYNACIDYLTAQNFNGYICLFDDDTEVTAPYFHALEAAVNSGGQIFVPFIYADNRLLSPCRLTPSHTPILFSDETAARNYRGADISAINSAMAMSMDLFRDYRYDENIFLDGIDHTHLQKMAQRGISISLLDVRFHHRFSADEKPPKNAAAVRFAIFAKDYAYIFRNRKMSYWYLVGKRAVRLSLAYHSFDFLNIMGKIRFPKESEAI